MYRPEKLQAPNRKLAERASDVTYAYDREGNLTFLNEEGERISGYSCEEARHMNIAELLGPEVAGRLHQELLSNAKDGVGSVYEVDIIAKDGRRVPLEVSTRIISREGQPIEIQGIAVPTVIRSEDPKLMGPRCLDENFSFGSVGRVSTIVVR
jgi:PAS domain S-box-containing protein